MHYYDTVRKTASSFSLSKVKDNRIFYNVRAERLSDTSRKTETGKYHRKKFDGLNESAKRSEHNLNLNVLPKELRRDEYPKDKPTTLELKQFI
jgi:lipopolysaccharide export system permease protein